METGLSENIKKVIYILLQEIKLQNREPINGIFLIHILSKKFTYLEDLDDIWRIVDKINKEANKWVLSVVSESVFNKSLSSDKTGGPDKLTKESITKLRGMGTGNEHYLSLGFEKERYFYFVIEDIEKLKKLIKKTKGEIINTSKNFYFNQSNGELSRYPKEKNKSCSFAVEDGRYKVMECLIEEKENGDSYVTTTRLTHTGEYKNKQKCRESIHEIRKKIQVTFKDMREDKFIQSQQKDGYRINTEITVLFEDTP